MTKRSRIEAPAIPAAVASVPVIPVPSGVTGEWFPASVRLPGTRAVLRMQRVFATPEGLYLYSKVPTVPDQSLAVAPNWHSPINYELTPVPPAAQSQASKLGFQITTEAGVVTVQMTGACPCGAKALRDWRPVWSTSQLEWKA